MTLLEFRSCADCDRDISTRNAAAKLCLDCAKLHYRTSRNEKERRRLICDPEYRKRKNAKRDARRRRRMAVDAEYRERERARLRAKPSAKYEPHRVLNCRECGDDISMLDWRTRYCLKCKSERAQASRHVNYLKQQEIRHALTQQKRQEVVGTCVCGKLIYWPRQAHCSNQCAVRSSKAKQQAKLKTDPALRAIKNQKSRAQFAKLMADPMRRALRQHRCWLNNQSPRYREKSRLRRRREREREIPVIALRELLRDDARECEHCHRPFAVKISVQRYCSYQCRQLADRAQQGIFGEIRKWSDPSGQRFGRWLVLGRLSRSHGSWLCRCDCGTEKPVNITSLKKGMSTSCGCARNELRRRAGHTSRPRTTLTNCLNCGEWMLIRPLLHQKYCSHACWFAARNGHNVVPTLAHVLGAASRMCS